MYPEARYSPCGTRSYIPESLGKLVKKNGVPVVACVHHGNHLHSPFWNFRKKRKVPLHTTVTKILTSEQIKQMSVDEINAAIVNALEYDDYRYQKENGILVKEDYRAEGLHKVLYQCPNCMTESKMNSKGTEIFCTECGKPFPKDMSAQKEAWKAEGRTVVYVGHDPREFYEIFDRIVFLDDEPVVYDRDDIAEHLENETHFEALYKKAISKITRK